MKENKNELTRRIKERKTKQEKWKKSMKTDGFLLKKKGKQRETKRKYKKNMNDESRIRRIPTDERMKSYEFKGTKNNA